MKIILRAFERFTPDPFFLALGLTLAVAVLSVLLTPVGAVEIAQFWGEGFSSLLAFTMQMVLMLLGGLVLAESRPIQKFLIYMASRLRTPSSAIVAVTLVSAVGCWINWGLGLVVAAFFAVAVARNLGRAPFALLVAASYSGMLVWHGGLSGSIPLSVNTEGHPLQGLLGGTLSVEQTLFSLPNLILVGQLLFILPLVCVFMLRWSVDVQVPMTLQVPEGDQDTNDSLTPARRWERQSWPALFVLLLGFVYLGSQIINGNFQLDLNQVNLILYVLAVAAHGSVSAFVAAVERSAGKVGPLLVQYPLYAGIMGIVSKSGLGVLISESMIRWSTAQSLPLLTFLSAGVLNIFVPSGGGQWAIQGPIAIRAAQAVGADVPKVIMSVAWGDAWTNMIQPFWALPVLAIAGLKASDIMGYCAVITVVSGVLIGSVLWLV